MRAAHYELYTGGYTGDGSEGLYRILLNERGGVLDFRPIATLTSPTYLYPDRQRSRLYAVSEYRDGAALAALSVSEKGCAVADTRVFEGSGACHLNGFGDNRVMAVACYLSGDLVGFGTEASLPEVWRIRPPGDGKTPHAHCTACDRAERYMVGVDLGQDTLSVYDISQAIPSLAFKFACGEGDGPRHVVFHPNGQLLYCANELASTVSSYHFSPANGTLSPIACLTASGRKGAGENSTAGILTAANGRWLFLSNRGADTISVFSLLSDGRMVPAGEYPCGGCFPRHIMLTKDERLMVVSNQRSNNVSILPVDLVTGGLGEAVGSVTLHEPACTVEWSF